MSSLGGLLTNPSSMQFNPVKVAGVYRKPIGGRKRSSLITELHDPTPKKWMSVIPKGVKHDQAKPKRLEDIQKNLKSVARQMADRKKKDPKREERIGHEWMKPSFEQRMRKYFKTRSVANVDVTGDKPVHISTIIEHGLYLLRRLGEPIPESDKPKLLKELDARAAGTGKTDSKSEKSKKKKK